MIDIYVTFPNIKEAKKISRLLLENRLAACVNMFPINSMYWWQGKIADDKEIAALIKTRKKNFKKIESLVAKHHSYSAPCIIQLPVTLVYKPYKKWLYGETRRRKKD